MMKTTTFWRVSALLLGCLAQFTAQGQVSQSLGNLANGESVTITFDVPVNSPLTAAVTQLSAQGTVSGDNFTTVSTDDPETVGGNDATLTVLNQTFDFSDAPDATYPTLLASNGARHFIPAGGATLYLGSAAPDGEADGQPNASATGDGADEDGVSLPALLLQGLSAAADVTVTGGPGFLNGWVDFNDDGDWSDLGEQVFTDQAVSAGVNNLSFAVPAGAVSGTSFARFRLTSAASGGTLAPTGLAADGEVEDYAVTINTAPVAVADGFTVAEGGTLNRTDGRGTTTPGDSTDNGVLANDTDTDGQTLTAAVVAGPSFASSFTLNADGSFSYTHDGSENFADSFTYQANDGALDSSTVTVSLTITEVNDPPVAGDDTLTDVAEDSGVRVISFASLTGNDSAGTGEGAQTLTVISVANAVGGSAVINGSNVEFTPTADFSGPAGFDYTVEDNGTTAGANDFKTDTGAVSFNFIAANDPPVATDDTLSDVAEASGVRVISFAALTGNDSAGPSEGTQTLTVISVANATGGSVAINGSNVEFTPTADYSGPAGFDYTMEDNGTTAGSDDFKSDTGAVGFSITAVNDPPVAGTDTLTRSKGRTVKVLKSVLLGNDTDVDGPSALTIMAVTSPSVNGATVRILGDYVVYEADAGDANDSFTYTVGDGADTSLGTVTVTVSDPTGVMLNIVLDETVVLERHFTVAGIPGRAYKLQIAGSVSGPWSDVPGAEAAGSTATNGELLLKDTAPPGGTTFYRVIEP